MILYDPRTEFLGQRGDVEVQRFLFRCSGHHFTRETWSEPVSTLAFVLLGTAACKKRQLQICPYMAGISRRKLPRARLGE